MRNKAPDIRILTVRDQKVVLDGDLAAVYGVTTKRLNEQFRRNRKRFPEDFAFQLTSAEFEALTSQFATLDKGSPRGETKRSQSATTSRKRRRKTHRPWAFTEHDTALRDIYQKLLPLLAPPPEPPRRQIGFSAAS
jgi:ORF6N domain-containing protein